MQEKFREAVDLIKKADSVKVITHIDADGLSAGGIITRALNRLGKDFDIFGIPGIYKSTSEELEPADLTIFMDLGSGQLDLLHSKFNGNKTIILDHHQVFGSAWKELLHINPSLQGLDGSKEVCGSGLAYLLAKSLDLKNVDLSALAVVGAVGDIQNFWGKLEGINREILEDSVNAGVVAKEDDLLFYGRHTRPVYKSMQYFTDPFIPGVSNSESGAISLLNALDVSLKNENKWRTLVDLSREEKRKIADELIQRAMEKIPRELLQYVPGLVIGEVYTLLNEKESSELRGAFEFSTCLNATGRNDRPDIGMMIAQGKRGVYYNELLSLLRKHRKNLAKALEFVEVEGINFGPKNYLQYFDARWNIHAKIIGTTAGMALGMENTDPYKPMVGFAKLEDGIKVSARCSRILVLQKVDMASAIRNAAKSVGGYGGGHSVACGAFIPDGSVEKFVGKFESELVNAL